TFLMGMISARSIAAHVIALQIASLAFMVPLGLAMAATVRVGRAYGAADWAAVTRGGWTACGLALVYACCTAALMLFGGRALACIFLTRDIADNQLVIDLAVTFLMLAGLFQLVDSGQAIGMGMLRGLHDTRVPMIFAALGYWAIGLPFGVLLAFPLGLNGV